MMKHKERMTKIITLVLNDLCNYSNAYILVKGTITVANIAVQDALNNAANKKATFKNFTPFTNCISRINNTQVDDAQDIDVVIPG